MISLVIPTRDKHSRLETMLAHVAKLNAHEDILQQVIIVDDGSVDPVSDENCRPLGLPGLRIIRHEFPKGRAPARNAGAHLATSARILFLDDDILPEPGVLTAHSRLGDNDAQGPAIGRAPILNLPWLRHLDDPRIANAGPENLRSRAESLFRGGDLNAEAARRHGRRSTFENRLSKKLDIAPKDQHWLGCTGGNLSVSRRLFESAGTYDEAFGLDWGVEDIELGYRLFAKGGQLARLNDGCVYHLDHQVADRDIHQKRPLAHFLSKHGSPAYQALCALVAPDSDRQDAGE